MTTTFSVRVRDLGVGQSLEAVQARLKNLEPALKGLGEDVVSRVHRRFDSGTSPDGQRWTPNAPATLAAFSKTLGSSYYSKAGGLNKRGTAAISAKKPLIGESGDLSRQIGMATTAFSLRVFSTPEYAAIHQFGGMAGRGRKTRIPARPFMPIKADGTLYADEQRLLVTALAEFLNDGTF